ncbi:hypothetical protein [Streptomyces sp. NPDC126503]|uniref:hypothetical protein n=1 Tax=Streptomyces sp. NPDC126503 TaxID=3155315 RepID=UPI003325893D
MTEQTTARAAEAEAPAPVTPGPTGPAPAASRRPRRARWAVARWTAAVVVCGGVGTGTALGITALDRADVPGLETRSDGRWSYPPLRLPALPADRPRPFTAGGNDGEIHHADVRQLLLPAPAGATPDAELNGGWVSDDAYLATYGKEWRAPLKQALRDSALRHITARGWTTPDGTTTRIHLLRFTSVAFAEEFRIESVRSGDPEEALPEGVTEGEIQESAAGDVQVPGVAAYVYQEKKPYGPERTRWAYVQAGDTLALVTQSRAGEALTVPFQQTVALQAQLLG